MRRTDRRSSGNTFTFRIDPELKAEFIAVTQAEDQPVAQVLRTFMSAYIARKRQKEFESEARRQSSLVSESPDESNVMSWISDVADLENWK